MESPMMDYFQFRQNLYKQYGFTEKDWHKAIHQTMSISEKDCYWDGIGIKKEVQNNKERVAKKLERDLRSGKQDYFDRTGEAEIKEEDRWLGDVSDEWLAYETFLDLKDAGKV